MSRVRIGSDVINLLADVRDFLQSKCEPPVYVSDRRLVKAVNMLKVAAYTNGRDTVSLYDCMLLQHTLWQRPEEKVGLGQPNVWIFPPPYLLIFLFSPFHNMIN